jgi:hypothetical protein
MVVDHLKTEEYYSYKTMNFYVVCRSTHRNYGNSEEQHAPVAVFDNLRTAKLATLKHDLAERTTEEYTKYAEWPNYTIFEIGREWKPLAKNTADAGKALVHSTTTEYNPDPNFVPSYHTFAFEGSPRFVKPASVRVYDFLTVALELYPDTKDAYDLYYDRQRRLIDKNNASVTDKRNRGFPLGRGEGLTDPGVIGFEPF